MSAPSAARFSGRVENYARARPGYPREAIDCLFAACELRAGSVVADVGFGTGLLTRALLERGCIVYGVEPNSDMRTRGADALADFAQFTCVEGSAEATTLPDASVDLVAAAQAFHWFDPERAREEFARILVPGGWVAILWNYRRREASAFMAAYEALLHRYCPEYPGLLDPARHRARVAAFFGQAGFEQARYEHAQSHDYAELEAKHLSQSYVPLSGPAYGPMMDELRALFEAHQTGGRIAYEYETLMYRGRLTAA